MASQTFKDLGIGPFDEARDEVPDLTPGIHSHGRVRSMCVDFDVLPGATVSALSIPGTPAYALQMNIDSTVLIVVQVLAAAASGGNWEDDRKTLLTSAGVETASEEDTVFGTVADYTADYTHVRAYGVDGHRWSVRVTGYAADATVDLAPLCEETLAGLVVRRGDEAREPGSPLDHRLTNANVG